MESVEKNSLEVPSHLRNNYSSGPKYKYPHDYSRYYVKQQYLPDGLTDVNLYEPKESGYEARIKKFMEYLNS
jgi:putative ATPase